MERQPGSFARGLRAKMRFVIQKQRGKRQKQRTREIGVRVTHSGSARRRSVLSGRLAGWIQLEGGGGVHGGAAPARTLCSSFTAHADTVSTDYSANATLALTIILLVLISHSLMRYGAKHVPLGVLGRQLDAPRRNKCVSPTQSSVRRTLSGASAVHLPFANPRAYQLIQQRPDDNAERTAAPNWPGGGEKTSAVYEGEIISQHFFIFDISVDLQNIKEEQFWPSVINLSILKLYEYFVF